jgi:predicted TPR repeat methyltransferase
VVAAAEAYHSALTFAPGDPEIAKAYDDVQRIADAKLAESHTRKAMLEERFGRWAAAVESWKHVVEAKPDDADARARLANAIARAGGHSGA